MKNIGEGKQCWIPIDIKNIEEIAHRRVINPEDAIIKLLCIFWVVIKFRTKFF